MISVFTFLDHSIFGYYHLMLDLKFINYNLPILPMCEALNTIRHQYLLTQDKENTFNELIEHCPARC